MKRIKSMILISLFFIGTFSCAYAYDQNKEDGLPMLTYEEFHNPDNYYDLPDEFILIEEGKTITNQFMNKKYI